MGHIALGGAEDGDRGGTVLGRTPEDVEEEMAMFTTALEQPLPQ